MSKLNKIRILGFIAISPLCLMLVPLIIFPYTNLTPTIVNFMFIAALLVSFTAFVWMFRVKFDLSFKQMAKEIILLLRETSLPNKKTLWTGLGKVLRYFFTPQYYWQKWHYKSASVIEWLDPKQSARKGLTGYNLSIQFDHHRDCQTLYPAGWMTRYAYIRISKRLFKERPTMVHIFCQYSRHLNTPRSVRVKVAR